MNKKLVFDGDGFDDYLYWQTQDRKILKRINQLLKVLIATVMMESAIPNR